MTQRTGMRLLGTTLLAMLVASCTSDPKGLDPQGPYLVITPDWTTMDEGETDTFNAKFGDDAAPVTWTSSNDAVASVSSTGFVTAKTAGFASIYAALTSNPAVKTGVSVTVVATLPSIALTSGVGLGIASSGARGSSVLYRIFVPKNSTKLDVTLSGGTGDADIYVRAGTAPTFTSNTCASENGGNGELCSITNPPKGTYYIMVAVWDAYAGATLKATVQ